MAKSKKSRRNIPTNPPLDHMDPPEAPEKPPVILPTPTSEGTRPVVNLAPELPRELPGVTPSVASPPLTNITEDADFTTLFAVNTDEEDSDEPTSSDDEIPDLETLMHQRLQVRLRNHIQKMKQEMRDKYKKHTNPSSPLQAAKYAEAIERFRLEALKEKNEGRRLALEVDKMEQQKISEAQFKNEKDIIILQNDLYTVAYSRPGWAELLTVRQVDKTTCLHYSTSLIYEFNKIDQQEIDRHYATRVNSQDHKSQRSARNMYVAVYNSLANKVKLRLQPYSRDIKNDGPNAIYFLLKTYSGDAQPMVRHCQNQINHLDLESYNYNVDDFCVRVDQIWTNLKNSGGTDDNAAQKVYEVLARSKQEEFNSNLKAWKAAQENNDLDRSKDLSNVLIKAKSFYKALELQGHWIPKTRCTNHKSTNNTDKLATSKIDIAALQATVSNLTNTISRITTFSSFVELVPSTKPSIGFLVGIMLNFHLRPNGGVSPNNSPSRSPTPSPVTPDHTNIPPATCTTTPGQVADTATEIHPHSTSPTNEDDLMSDVTSSAKSASHNSPNKPGRNQDDDDDDFQLVTSPQRRLRHQIPISSGIPQINTSNDPIFPQYLPTISSVHQHPRRASRPKFSLITMEHPSTYTPYLSSS